MYTVFTSRHGSVRCSTFCGHCCQAVDARGGILTGGRAVSLAEAFQALREAALSGGVS